MANNCAYDMLVVGKSKEDLDRMQGIMEYKDDTYSLYRVFDVDCADGPLVEDGMWKSMLVGDVAWSPEPWIRDEPDMSMVNSKGAHMSNLQEICKSLGIGVEVWAYEYGMGFQGHFIVDHTGRVAVSEFKTDLEIDQTKDFGDEFKNGFEDFGEFSSVSEIYG